MSGPAPQWCYSDAGKPTHLKAGLPGAGQALLPRLLDRGAFGNLRGSTIISKVAPLALRRI